MTRSWAVLLLARISSQGALYAVHGSAVDDNDGDTSVQVDWAGSASVEEVDNQAPSSLSELGSPELAKEVGLPLKAVGHLAEVEGLQKRLLRRGDRESDSPDERWVEDCDKSPINTTEKKDRLDKINTAETETLAGFAWLLRLVQPCKEDFYKRHIAQWELFQLTMHTSSCSNASVDNIAVPWRVQSSGQATETYNTDLAFDGDMDTSWRGAQDSSGEIWIEAKFQQAVHVKCVRFFQCNCVRSARAVAVEASATSSENWEWVPVTVQNTVQMGEWTTIQI